jgi:hypothetical protein
VKKFYEGTTVQTFVAFLIFGDFFFSSVIFLTVQTFVAFLIFGDFSLSRSLSFALALVLSHDL